MRQLYLAATGQNRGKTTTALQLAASLTAAGHRVILIEADVRRPSIGAALGIDVDRGLVSVLLGQNSVGEALGWTEEYGPNLQLLLAEETGPAIAELVSLPVAKAVMDEAEQHADYVIVDSPPLTQVIDALPLASYVDDVLLVVRLGQSHLRQIKELGELLAGVGVTPAGVAIVGMPRGARHYYSSYFEEPKRGSSAPSGGRKAARGPATEAADEAGPEAGEKVDDGDGSREPSEAPGESEVRRGS